MKERKNKYDFIQEILESKKLTVAQRERVLKLAKEEIKKEGVIGKELEDRIRKLEEKLDDGQKKKNQLTHNPMLVSKYLNKFKDNTPLKWATHVWDEKKYETIDLFIEDLNKDKDYNTLFNIHRDLYNLIDYFIYDPKKYFHK
jgi:hypothetical protein